MTMHATAQTTTTAGPADTAGSASRALFTLVVASALLAACASKPVDDQAAAPVEQRTPATASTPVPPPTTSGATTGSVPGKAIPQPPAKSSATPPANPLRDPNNILSKRSIYFDYDSELVKDEFKPVVTAHSKYLTDNRGRRVTIQGHTDERGTREYNLALGQRRADAVKKMMMLLGVTEQQLESVSFGKEKPKATGGDEAAYAQNRRSDIVYDGE
jgi:peptidoglycan-associated lipoprotein